MQVVEVVETCHSEHVIDVLVVRNSLVAQRLLPVANHGVRHREEVGRTQDAIIELLVFWAETLQYPSSACSGETLCDCL